MDALMDRLLTSARTGEILDLGGGSAFDRRPDHGAEFDVPTQTLLRLLRGKTEERVHPRGIRLRGARLVGAFSWDWQTLVAPLELIDCIVEEPVRVAYAHVAGLSFRTCVLPGFSGEMITSQSHLRFDGSNLLGPIDVHGAKLKGSLIASGATVVSGDGGVAIDAARLHTERGLVLDKGFTAHGTVMLRAATIAGALYCDGGRLINPGGEALNADNITVGGGLFMRDGFSASGRVRLLGARITSNIDCAGAQFHNPDGEDALWLSGAEIGGNLRLYAGFVSSGRIRMNNVTVGGRIDLKEARLSYPQGHAIEAKNLELRSNFNSAGRPGQSPTVIEGQLSLEGSHVRGSILLDNTTVTNAGDVAIDAQDVHVGGNLRMGKGFTAIGEVRLGGIRVGGYLGCDNSLFSSPGGIALDLVNAEITGSAVLRPNCVIEGELGLRRARFDSALELEGATLTNPGGRAVFAHSLQVARAFWLKDSTVTGSVQLEAARIGGDLDLRGTVLSGSALAFDGEGMTVGGSLHWSRMPHPPQGRIDWRRATVAELDDDASGWPAENHLQLSGFRYLRLSDHAPRTTSERLTWIRRQQGYAPEPYQQLAEVYRAGGQVAEATVVAMAQQDDLVSRGELTRPARLWKRFLGRTIGHGYRPGRAAWMLLALYLITVGPVLVGANHNAFIQVGQTAPQSSVTSSRCDDAYPCFSAPAYALENITPFVNLHQSENWHPKGSTPLELALRDWLYLCTVAGYAGTTLLAAGLSGLARNS